MAHHTRTQGRTTLAVSLYGESGEGGSTLYLSPRRNGCQAHWLIRRDLGQGGGQEAVQIGQRLPLWGHVPMCDRQCKKKKSNHARPSWKITKRKERKERKEGRHSRVSGVRVDGKRVFKDNEEMTDSPEIVMLTETWCILNGLQNGHQ